VTSDIAPGEPIGADTRGDDQGLPAARPASHAANVPASTPGVILRIVGLHRHFGGVKALNGIDLSVEKGEVRCVIGPNGSGKSTLFKLITGIHAPTAGSIMYGGGRIDGLRPFEVARRGISMKFQVPRTYLQLTVRQNLRIALQRTRLSRAGLRDRMRDLLHLVTLAEFEEAPAGLLPHGQKQWLEIGMAIAIGPRLLLLDEPTAGMTPDETRRTADIVKQINQQADMTVVVIEHDMDFVRYIDRRISVLHQGRVFFEGDLAAVSSDQGVREIYLGS